MTGVSNIWFTVLAAEFFIFRAFAVVCLIVAVVALMKCLPKNAERFEIAFKRTKGFWLAMCGGAVVLTLIGALGGAGIFAIMFPVIGACMAMVYLTDVNPEVSG